MLEKFKCENKKVNLEDYLKLYKYVRDSMIHPEWLGTFTKEEIEEAYEKNIGTYGRFADAVKYIDPREE